MSKIHWNKNQPMVLYLRRWLPIYLPRVRKVGGYVNRTTDVGTFSAHSEGRAADIYLDAGDPLDRQVGDALFLLFQEYAAELGVDHTIWNREQWSVDRGGPRPYPKGRNPHTNHVHVAFTREGSQEEPALLLYLLGKVSAELYGAGSLGGVAGRAVVDAGERLEEEASRVVKKGLKGLKKLSKKISRMKPLPAPAGP